MTREETLGSLRDAIVRFDIDSIETIAENTLKQGISAYEGVVNGMAKGMEIVGQKYQQGEYFLPELVMAGETFKEGMKILGPHLKPSELASQGCIVIGTVEGDLHDIGKNIVASLVEASGFRVHDLGVDVNARQFSDKARMVSADVVAMSALLSTTFPHMREVIDSIKKMKINSKTLVGGAPLNLDTANSMGADGYGRDAVEGAKICRGWAAKKHFK